jgi:predicted membrane-bound dolichyl-phosphate-mannose-protein mannosyltransferase
LEEIVIDWTNNTKESHIVFGRHDFNEAHHLIITNLSIGFLDKIVRFIRIVKQIGIPYFLNPLIISKLLNKVCIRAEEFSPSPYFNFIKFGNLFVVLLKTDSIPVIAPITSSLIEMQVEEVASIEMHKNGIAEDHLIKLQIISLHEPSSFVQNSQKLP